MQTMTPLQALHEVIYHADNIVDDCPTASTILIKKSLLIEESNPERATTGRRRRPSQQQQQQQHTNKVKKSVDFNPKVRVRHISTHRQFSQLERAAVWYSPQESQEIRQEAIATVKKLMKKIPVDGDPHDCSRGLEFKTPKKNKLRQRRKAEIIYTVLSELAICVEEERDPEMVAQIYTSVSRGCLEEAAERGALDAIEAR